MKYVHWLLWFSPPTWLREIEELLFVGINIMYSIYTTKSLSTNCINYTPQPSGPYINTSFLWCTSVLSYSCASRNRLVPSWNKMAGDKQKLFNRLKPFIGVVFLQFGYAGMDVLSKAALNKGMSNYVFVVYRHVFAFVVTAPFALILEKYFFSLPYMCVCLIVWTWYWCNAAFF